jgi:hypothetical protein
VETKQSSGDDDVVGAPSIVRVPISFEEREGVESRAWRLIIDSRTEEEELQACTY